MNTASCPSCGKSLPATASYCIQCGEAIAPLLYGFARVQYRRVDRSASTTPKYFASISDKRLAIGHSVIDEDDMLSPTLTYVPPTLPFSHLSRHTPADGSVLPASSTRLPDTPIPDAALPDKFPDEDDEMYGNEEYEAEDALLSRGTWHKELDTPLSRVDDLPRPRPSSPHPVVLLNPHLQAPHQRIYRSPRPFFWLSLVVLIVLLLGGFFGLFTALGHGLSNGSAIPTLTLSARTLAVGEMLALHGTHFTPGAQIGLSLDTSMPVNDINGRDIIRADAQGNFSDTLIVLASWQAGPHTMNAEDAVRHKIVGVSFFVTGTGNSIRPPHLGLSASKLNMGVGGPAMNSEQVVTLTNAGGSQLSWQAKSNQAWLLLSPMSGTLVSGQVAQVVVAVDRTSMNPGAYVGQIFFASNAGNAMLTVNMQVIPFNAQAGSTFGVTPAVLSFTSVDGANAPPPQNVTLSNLGSQALQWSVSSNQPWLTISPLTGTVQGIPSANVSTLDNAVGQTPTGNTSRASSNVLRRTQSSMTQSVEVTVNSRAMLPGIYTGVLTFANGQTNDVQQVSVSLTIQPQCTIQVAPSLLTFAAIYQQAVPSAKSISLHTSQECTSPIKWSVTSDSSWLSVSNVDGTTPASPQVSVNVAGLAVGSYAGSLVFSTSSGTQTLPVNLVVGQPTAPTMSLDVTTLNYSAVAGSADPAAQVANISNTGGGTITWQASVATSVGGNWLTVSPTSGTLVGKQSNAMSISAVLLSTLVPGTYSGTITLSGTDSAGQSIVGSPQVIQVNLTVLAACSVTALPTMLSFAGVAGQAITPQSVALTASGACADPISWSASVTNSWLVPTPTTGTLTKAGNVGVGVSLTGLKPGTYLATLTISSIDSVTKTTIGVPQNITATLTVQVPCTLLAPSSTSESYSAESGQSGGTQTFSIGASGTCSGGVVVTPVVSLSAGNGWLTVTPANATIASGTSTVFSVTASAASLRAGTYTASITLAGLNGGTAIAGSPQVIGVTFTVSAAPVLSASPGTAATHSTGGVSAQPVVVANTGGNTLNWTAQFGSGTPAFLSLSAASGVLTAGASTTVDIVANTPSTISGTYTVNVILAATDAVTGGVVNGSPTTVAVTVRVAPPTMQVSATSLSYTANAGSSPTPQSLTVTNGGGDTLSWSVGSFSAAWLSASPTSGSDVSGSSSPITFTANTTSLAPGTYSETATITPSVGQAVTISISVTVVAVSPTPTPTATVGVTPGITSTATPTATPTAIASATATKVITPTPTFTATGTPAATPTAASEITLTPSRD